MLRKLRPRFPSHATVVAYLALFVALGGTSAYAINEWNSSNIQNETLLSEDVKNGTLKAEDYGVGSVSGARIQDNNVTTLDLADGAIFSNDVRDNSLTGGDINEGSLGTVPSAVLGGLGRMGVRQDGSQGPGRCDPESLTFVNCDIVARLDLTRPARVLVIGSVEAVPDNFDQAFGECLLGTTSGPIAGTQTGVGIQDDAPGFKSEEHLSIAAVTGVFPAGQHAFGIDCNDRDVTAGEGIQYEQAKVTAVALSDG